MARPAPPYDLSFVADRWWVIQGVPKFRSVPEWIAIEENYLVVLDNVMSTTHSQGDASAISGPVAEKQTDKGNQEASRQQDKSSTSRETVVSNLADKSSGNDTVASLIELLNRGEYGAGISLLESQLVAASSEEKATF